MESLSYLIPILLIAGVGVLALVAVAIVQDLKQERKYGYRQAFYTVVALVMIALAVGSTAALLTTGLKASVFTKASNNYRGAPQPLFLPGSGTTPTTAYTCEQDCQFTAADKTEFTNWKTMYQDWVNSTKSNLQIRRDLAGSLSLFLLSVPLFFIFSRLMNRGAAEETKLHNRLSPLRSVYFYGVAFGGLVLGVVAGAMLINTTLKVVLKTESSTTIISQPIAKVPGEGVVSESTGVDSVIACGSKCGFTADDLALAAQWKTDYANATAKGATSTTQSDLANSIPLFLLGVPLFWYHFARIRKETQAAPTTPAAPTIV